LFFSTAELEGAESHGGVIEIGIFDCLLKNRKISILRRVEFFESIKTPGGKVGCGEPNAGLLRLAGGQFKLDRSGFVKLLGEKNLAQPERAGGGELARLELLHKLFVAGAGSCGIGR
jgi:hypothetical protein